MNAPQQVGRYELLDAIASGGMAKVYLARFRGARGFERHVALKVMHPHLVEDPDFVAMFLDEARMVANIRHPNVVPTLDVVEEDGQLFLVMEYVEGLSLQTLIRALKKRDQNIPLDCALRIAVDMLMGLHAAHEMLMPDGSPMNIVHRDVSPHNVMVGIDGVSRIMDFGVARAESRLNSTMGTNPKGKLPYMSPEQLGGQKVDRRSDIYSAAIVVWEMLAGRVLFRADNDGALMIIVAVGPTQSPTDVNAEVPAAISAACMRALALQANDRYPTAMAFADALEAAAREAHVTIAAPRTVGALVKECPPERPRTSSIVSRPGGGSGSVDSAPVSMGSGVSGQSAPVSRSPASVGHAPQNPSGAEIPRTSESGRTPSSISTSLAAESTRQDSVVTPARGTAANRRNMLVAAVSVVVVGAVVWLVLTAGRGNPATAVQDDRNGAPAASEKTALVAPSSALDPLPETSSSAPTNPTSDKRATATSATSKTRPGTAPAPRATSKSSTFRPEEP